MFSWFSNFFLFIARKVLYIFVRTTILPENLDELGLDSSKPVCYVLQTRFLSNLLVLDTETRRLDIHRALRPMQAPLKESRSLFFLTRSDSPSALERNRFAYSSRFVSLVKAVRENPDLDVQLIPVTILWGRSPDKVDSPFKALFTDSWATPGVFRQLLTILIHGRQTFVRFNSPVSLRNLADEGLSEEMTMRKLSRVLRVHFRRQREAAIGPDLSHRRTLVKSLLAAPSVQEAITQESKGKNIDREKVTERARKYADEIAADYSYSVVRAFEIVLNWIWTRLYDGVEVNHFDTVRTLSHDHEIVYVPCHRSHIDYLLLSFVIFRRGLMTPHIAAGANLNMPVVGPLLRRAGAFFLRRSFKGNFLYAAVFNEYLHQITAKGYSIEYFVEGGRSRTGRLLSARTGMLSMTLRSYLRDHQRPIVFIPAYIGYEKLMEGKTYVGELAGKPKQKETLLGLLFSLRKIQRVFGQVHLNFGEPIYLEKLLDDANPDWRDTPVVDDAKTPWMTETINTLAAQITTNINSAAAVNPVNLLSFVLLSTSKHAMAESALEHQLNLYRDLLATVPYSDRFTLTPLNGAEIIAYGEKLQMLYRIKHPLGDMIGINDEQAMLMTYFRNNVMHLFTLPSLIACLMQHNGELYRVQITQLVQTIYPFMRSELFLPWCSESVENIIHQWLDVLVEKGLLIARDNQQYVCPSPTSASYAELHILAQGVRQSLQRYFITVSLLTRHGSGNISRKQLEDMGTLLAQRMAILHEFSAPEYFDKAVFRNFVETLLASGIVQTDTSGNLQFDARLNNIASESRLVLDSGTSQAIQQITQVSAEEVSNALEAANPKKKESA